MIDKTLAFVLGELNAFLGTVFPASEPHAVLSSLAQQDGSPPPGIENKILLTLINVERDTTAFAPNLPTRTEAGLATRVNPPLNLNLNFLVSASFTTDYLEALRFLSSSLGFFQSKPVFTPQNSPAFPRGLERLTMEMVNVSIPDLQNLWASAGAKYLPSALYKARMLTIQDGWVAERVPTITGTETKV